MNISINPLWMKIHSVLFVPQNYHIAIIILNLNEDSGVQLIFNMTLKYSANLHIEKTKRII